MGKVSPDQRAWQQAEAIERERRRPPPEQPRVVAQLPETPPAPPPGRRPHPSGAKKPGKRESLTYQQKLERARELLAKKDRMAKELKPAESVPPTPEKRAKVGRLTESGDVRKDWGRDGPSLLDIATLGEKEVEHRLHENKEQRKKIYPKIEPLWQKLRWLGAERALLKERMAELEQAGPQHAPSRGLSG